MPMASDPQLSHLLRSLLYGKAKAKKTWWACRAAQAGFNVILLDGDDGSHIVKQLPMDARKRILVVNLVNTQTRAVFAEFMVQFCRPRADFCWDEQDKKSIIGTKDKGHSYIRFRPGLFTPNDVLIIDSWTALAWAMRLSYAIEHKIDLLDAERTDWDGFGFEGRFLDYVLNYLHAMPCHVIVIGHAHVYEKRAKDGKTIVSQETIPISSSGPAGMKLAKHFSDVLFFERITEEVVKVKTGGDGVRDGGSRLLKPGTYDWNETGPELLLNAVNAKSTGMPCEGAVWYSTGTEADEATKAPPKVSVLPAPTNAPAPATQPIAVSAQASAVQMPAKPSGIFGKLNVGGGKS